MEFLPCGEKTPNAWSPSWSWTLHGYSYCCQAMLSRFQNAASVEFPWGISHNFSTDGMSVRWCLVACKVVDLQLFKKKFLENPKYTYSCQGMPSRLQSYQYPGLMKRGPLDSYIFQKLSGAAPWFSKMCISPFSYRHSCRFPSVHMAFRLCLVALEVMAHQVFLLAFLHMSMFSCGYKAVLDRSQSCGSLATLEVVLTDSQVFLCVSDVAWSPSKLWILR